MSFQGFCVEFDSAEHIAVVGDRDGVHLQLLTAIEQVAKIYCAVEQRILAVQMKMCKSFARHKLTHPKSKIANA